MRTTGIIIKIIDTCPQIQNFSHHIIGYRAFWSRFFYITWQNDPMTHRKRLAFKRGSEDLVSTHTHKVNSSSSFTIILATISSFSKKCELHPRPYSKKSMLQSVSVNQLLIAEWLYFPNILNMCWLLLQSRTICEDESQMEKEARSPSQA